MEHRHCPHHGLIDPAYHVPRREIEMAYCHAKKTYKILKHIMKHHHPHRRHHHPHHFLHGEMESSSSPHMYPQAFGSSEA
ncbi:hypothetical protein [Thermoflavimicrobium dichotomicum]|uniref:Uncharacterized protein n=1 Tax=Thermoflavimicrobium dichotomicum TaxID=46223 RepID=A0A1I3TDT3_9BACL|nr:hypothetical protein [Thermoflavimicrobium dichotomicum]SFJ69304.1 hypothetical protein SAMN05421852_11736 [Thermoflavimicrobium dichotomicum]